MRLAKLALAALLFVTPSIALAQSSQDTADDDEAPMADPHGADAPHGGGGRGTGGMPDVFNPPADSVNEDSSLPAGTFDVTILDDNDKPLPHAMVTIGIIHNSVAKGESRARTMRETDPAGYFRVDGQETGSGVAYRVSVAKEGATFAATPFQLPQARGIKVRLHVYPVTHDIDKALVVMQFVTYAELKDDRVQLQTAMQMYNFGRTAWVPEGTMIELPPTFTALRGQEDMGDRGVDAIDKKGAKLRGTFGPGRWEVSFTWQLPYDGEKDVPFEVGLPPHIAIARIIAQASPGMTLDVPGLPPAQAQTDPEGQRLLVTEKQLARNDTPLTRLKITIGNLPTQGPGRYVASGLAALGILGGIAFAFTQQKAPSKSKKQLEKLEQDQILAELEELERLRKDGDIGPKTYERARRELIDALAQALSRKAEKRSR